MTAAAEQLLPQFLQQPVLLEPSRDLPARVSLVLDGPLASRDNSQSPLPAQSSYDGPGKTSLPPFSLDLVLKVEWAGRVYFYEALVQQRWPYVLAAPGPIRILGKATDPRLFPLQASRVEGSILAMRGPVTSPSSQRSTMQVDADFYELLLPHSSEVMGMHQLMLGGEFHLSQIGVHHHESGVSECYVTPGFPVQTEGARLEGNVDLYPNPRLFTQNIRPGVLVGENSMLTGQIRERVHFGGLDPQSQEAQQRMARLFDAPDTSDWSSIRLPIQSGLVKESLLITSQANSTLKTGNTQVIVVPSGRARCKNLEFYDGKQLILEDCALYCEANLRLRNPKGARTRELLKGTGATLVVAGELVVDGGEMDAGGNGMVIHAHHFLIRASGSYRGAIVAPFGGSFFGVSGGAGGASAREREPERGLVIRGGVVLGQNAIRFQVVDQEIPGDPPRLLKGLPERSLACPTLANTELIYDPQYLRGLNQFGSFHLKQLIRRYSND